MTSYCCGLVVCDVSVGSRHFEKVFYQTGEADMQDRRRTSSLGFFCTPLINIIIIIVRRTYRLTLFSSFRLGIDSGLVNLVNLESVYVLFWCITHRTNILYI